MLVSIEPGKYDERHGGAWDRGAADSYYSRPCAPHMYEGGTYMSRLIQEHEMTAEDIEAYIAGYRWNEEHDFKKSYD